MTNSEVLAEITGLEFSYIVHYADGKTREGDGMSIGVSAEEYRKVVQGIVVDNIPFETIPGIEPLLSRMQDKVRDIDKFFNRNGTIRRTALKKPRDIERIECTPDGYALDWLKKRKNPMAIFDYPSQSITLHRDDGSSVEITTELGRVMIRDSREKGQTRITDEERFANKVMW